MSDRAEELHSALDANGMGDLLDIEKARPIIDAALRKERERAAKRFCHACSLSQDADIEGCSLHESCAHCMLILSDEED